MCYHPIKVVDIIIEPYLCASLLALVGEQDMAIPEAYFLTAKTLVRLSRRSDGRTSLFVTSKSYTTNIVKGMKQNETSTKRYI